MLKMKWLRQRRWLLYGVCLGLLSCVGSEEGAFTAVQTQPPTPPALSVSATFSASLNVMTVSVDASASGAVSDISSYSWDFGDGSTASGRVATHTYSSISAAPWLIRLTLVSADKRTYENSQAVAINTLGTPAFSVSSTALSASFDASASTPQADIVSYAWDFGDGTTGSGRTTSRTYATAKTYVVKLTTTDIYGRQVSLSQNVATTCPSPQVLNNGSCITLPTLAANFSAQVVNRYVNFDATASSPAADIVSYAWSFGDVTTGTGVKNLHEYRAYGNYPVTLTITDRYNQTATYSQTILLECTAPNIMVNGSCTPPAMPNPSGILNDTGVSSAQCYASGSDTLVACSSTPATTLNLYQDGMVGRDTSSPSSSNGYLGFNFTKLDSNGNILADTVTTGVSCIKDNITGLIWEVKTSDGSISDKTKTFTNYGDNSIDDASYYVYLVNKTGLCGTNDWRLPAVDELYSLINYGVAIPGPLVDNAAGLFSDTQSGLYWSSTADVASTINANAWAIDFGYGKVFTFMARSKKNHLRLVRATTLNPSSRYTPSGTASNEITDNATKLIWRRCPEGTTFASASCTGTAKAYTHEQALAQAASEALADTTSLTSWRLPTIKELFSLVDKTKQGPAIDASFPAVSATSWYWSSTPQVGYSSYAWRVYFSSGDVSGEGRNNSGYVRLVRDVP